MRNILLLLAVLFAFGASAEAGAVRLKVKKSEVQPEVTAILEDSVFAQFTSIEVGVIGSKAMVLNEIVVRVYSSRNELLKVGDFFKGVYAVANTSPGNSSAAEMSVIGETIVDEIIGQGQEVVIKINHTFGDDARFTIVAIPKEDVFYQNDKTIGLAVIAVKATTDNKTVKGRGRFPIMGTEQLVKTTAYAGKVYWNKQQFYNNGNFYQAIYVHADVDVVVKKIVFADLISKGAIITTDVYGGGSDYFSVVDKPNGNTACNFYKKRELSEKETAMLGNSDGIYLPAGYYLYIVCKDDVRLVNQFSVNNNLVVVGAYLNYRYAPVKDEGEGKACFLAGTMIKMSDGKEKPIEEVKIGDSVWVGDGKSDKVKGIIRKNDPEWLTIVAGKQIVFTVPDQLFFVVAQEADGKPSTVNEIVYPATMIKVGDIIKNDKGEVVTVSAVSHIVKNKVPTWDLVLRNKTFYYADGFKVHSVMSGRSEEQLSAQYDH